MRCLSCHYSLTGLTENRCPECGREFDLHDPSSFRADTYKAPQSLPILQVSSLLFVVFVWLSWLDDFRWGSYSDKYFAWMLMAGSGLLTIGLGLFHALHFVRWKLRNNS